MTPRAHAPTRALTRARARRVPVLAALALLTGCPASPGMLTPPVDDVTAPTVVSTVPAAWQSDADVGGHVEITFSEEIDPSSATTAISVKKDGQEVAGTVSVSGATCTFAAGIGLEYGSTYEVTVLAGVRDLAGNAMAAPHSFMFYTGPASAYRPAGVSAVSPPERARNVDPNAPVAAWFTDPLDPASITSASFSVTSGGTQVGGALSYMDGAIFFTPDAPLEFGREYAVTLGSGLRAVGGGTPVPGGFGWWFRMRALGGAVARVDASTTFVTEPEIAAFGTDDVMVAWLQSDGTSTVHGQHFDVYAAHRSAGAWSAPTLVGDIDPGAAEPLRLRCGGGVCFAVWRQYDPGASWVGQIWASRWERGTGWGAPVAIDADLVAEEGLELAVGGDGSAVAVWNRNAVVTAVRFAPGTGWGPPVTLDGPVTGIAMGADVAVNASGAAVAAWVTDAHSGVNLWDLWSARYEPGSGWRAAEAIEAGTEPTGYTAHVAMDDSGNALAVWRQGGTRWNRFVPGLGWGAARDLSARAALTYRLGMDSGGRAVVVFAAYDYGDVPWVSTYDAATGWAPTAQLAPSVYDDDDLELAVAPEGDALVAWKGLGADAAPGSPPYPYVWATRYLRGTGWQPPVPIAPLAYHPTYGTSHYRLHLARAASGEALAAWSDDAAVWVGALP